MSAPFFIEKIWTWYTRGSAKKSRFWFWWEKLKPLRLAVEWSLLTVAIFLATFSVYEQERDARLKAESKSTEASSRSVVDAGAAVTPSTFISLTVSPSYARCSIDGENRAPPYGDIPVASGSHEIVCKSSGYGDERATIPVAAGQTSPIPMVLLKAGMVGNVLGAVTNGNAHVDLTGVSYDAKAGKFYLFMKVPRTEWPVSMFVQIAPSTKPKDSDLVASHHFPPSTFGSEDAWVFDMSARLFLRAAPTRYYAIIRACDQHCVGSEPAIYPVTFPEAAPPSAALNASAPTPVAIVWLAVSPETATCALDGVKKVPPYEFYVAPGGHGISCSATGYQKAEAILNAGTAEVNRIKLALSPLDAAAP